MERWDLSGKGFGWEHLMAFSWSSYFVGMELPGKQATFWKVRIEFDPSSVPSGEIEYKGQLKRLDKRFDLLEMTALLTTGGGQTLARAQLWAFMRAESPEPSSTRLSALMSKKLSLLGKVAVVIGGSRGLGSAIALALALADCEVYLLFKRSTNYVRRLQVLAAEAPGRIHAVQGDATNPENCQRLLDRITSRHGSIDMLICNASPPSHALGFAPDAMPRFKHFVDESLALVSEPMSVFLPSLEKKSGWTVIVSSEFVRTNPPQWPHYVTAKSAVEGLAHWAAAQSRQVGFLLIRPPKLLTDQTNTPLGRLGAVSTELIAATIASRLGEPHSGSSVEIIETFGKDSTSAEPEQKSPA